MWRRGVGLVALALATPALLASAAHAQETVPFSFEAAAARLDAASSIRRASNADVTAAEEQAAAARTLNRPTIAVDAQVLRYQKTFDISLSDALGQAESVANQLLPGIIGDLPGVPGDILQAINDRLETALPEFFASLPGSVRLKTADTSFRPVATAVMPIYTGGAIPALRDCG